MTPTHRELWEGACCPGLRRLCTAHGRPYTAELASTWYDATDGLPVAAIVEGLDSLLKTSRYMPAPGELRAALAGARQTNAMPAHGHGRPAPQPAHLWTQEDLARADYLDRVALDPARLPRGVRRQRIIDAEAEWDRTGRAAWIAAGRPRGAPAGIGPMARRIGRIPGRAKGG